MTFVLKPTEKNVYGNHIFGERYKKCITTLNHECKYKQINSLNHLHLQIDPPPRSYFYITQKVLV